MHCPLALAGDVGALCVVRAERGAATGFAFVHPRFVVTARHVVGDQPLERPLCLVFGGTIERPARVAFLHPSVDLAVLEVMGEPPCRTPLSPRAGGRLSPPLRRAGFRAADGRLSAFVREVPRFEQTTRSRDGLVEDLLMFAAPDGEPGHSGSPLMTQDGSVVAVVINGIRIAREYYIRATAVAPLLDHAASPMAQQRLDSGGWAEHA